MGWAIIECPRCGARMELGKYISMQTRADGIRSMSDEELADFIANACDHICKGTSCPLIQQNGITCEDRILEWLKQEAE